MNQRKLIKLGNSSFAIALPKEWVDRANLKKGDNVFLEENGGGEIIIMPNYAQTNHNKTKAFDFSGKSDLATQVEIISAYSQDNNTFKIKKTMDKLRQKDVKKLIGNLLSFEILEETKNEIIFKDIFNLEEANLKGFIRRMDNILRGMFEDLFESLKKGKISAEQLKELYLSDKEITKFYLFINRVFMKALDNPSITNLLKTNLKTLLNDWQISLNIEKIGDEAKRIAKILKEGVDPKISKKLSLLFRKIIEDYTLCMTNYHKKNKGEVYAIIDRKERMIEECEKFDKLKIPDIQKIAEKLKEIYSRIFQNTKMIIYSTEE